MVRIVTDSVSDLPKEYVENYDITVVPLKIAFGEDVYVDGLDIDCHEVFKRIEKDGEFPKTSQATPYEFMSIFDKLTQDGDEVIAVLMTSKLSGTYNSALIAKNELSDRKITVIDSKGLTLGHGMIALEGAKMVKAGMPSDSIIRRLNALTESMEYILVFDTLEYAYRGGRVNKTQYMIANVLNIKPIMTMKDGILHVRDKVRGRKKVVKWIMEYLEKNQYNLDDKVIGLNHTQDIEFLNELKSSILNKYKPKEIVVSEVGSSIAVYSGINAIALYFDREENYEN